MDEGATESSQTTKVVRLLERYGMSDANPIKLPIEPGWWPGDLPLLDDRTSYREVIGSLLYLAEQDIAFKVNIAPRAQDAPTQAHQQLTKHIMWYLKGTKED